MSGNLLYVLPSGSQDLTGNKFGRWTVVKFAHRKVYKNGTGHNFWECKCECQLETVKTVNGPSLLNGDSTSCGCVKLERIKEANTTHGLTVNGEIHPIIAAHRNMMARCYNEGVESYDTHGARGIRVQEVWHDVNNFIADMLPSWGNGLSPDGKKLTLDRIDNNSDYGPGLCKWSTHIEQQNNTRKNVFMTFKGRRQTVAQWARELGLVPQNIIGRLNCGWSDEDALTIPIGQERRKHP